MQRLFIYPLLLLLGLTPSIAGASLIEKFSPIKTAPAFLPVHEAFQFSGYLNNDEVVIFAQITPEHYLYKDQLKVRLQQQDAQLAPYTLPTGIPSFDPFQNREVEIYPESFELRIPYLPGPQSQLRLEISFQGCAKAGLCYPPETTILTLVADPLTQTPSSTRPASLDTNDERSFAHLLSDANLPIMLGLFFLAGLGLTFTPCVLPMAPILSSVIIGQRQQNRAHTLALTSTYILSMAATFALAGVLVGVFGASLNLQAKLQSPWVLIPLITLFVFFALSLFGLYELQLPSNIRHRLERAAQKQAGGQYLSVALLGILSSLVVSPCVSAPLAGVLVYISTTGDGLLGGLALFSLGLGMGVPLLLIGIGAGSLLPRAGAWMQGVKTLFGVLLLAVAIWLLQRLIPAAVAMLLWGALLVCCAMYLGALNLQRSHGWSALRQGFGILLLTWGVLLLIGAALGNHDPLRPLIQAHAQTTSKTTAIEFIQIDSRAELERELSKAKSLNKTAIVDFYADWCIACIQMEQTLFPQPEIAKELIVMHRIRLDITANTPEQQQLLSQYNLFGPPALLFFDATGHALESLHLRGEPSADTLLSHLKQANRPIGAP